MKLSCNVARDLLPLYHDGVCSDESRALVEDHVRDCAECGRILKELRGELEVPHEYPDDLAPLEKIEKNVKKGRKKAWMKGAAAVLAVVLVIFAGVNVWWYVGPHTFYAQFTEGQEQGAGYEQTVDGVLLYTVPADRESYVWSDGVYEFAVQMPEYLRDNGQVQVLMDFKRTTRSVAIGKDVQTYLFIGQDLYTYSVHLTIIDHRQNSGQAQLEVEATEECVMLDANLNQVYLDHWDEKTRQRQDQLLEEYRLEIMDIVEAAQEQWPFLTE